MFDPTSTVSAPPPRYLLESDSSDEEGQGQYGGASGGVRAPKLRVSAPEIALRPLGAGFAPPLQVQSAVVGVGQAGSYLLRSTGGRAKPLFSIEAGGDRLGTAVQTEDGLLVAVKDGKDWDVVRKLLDNVQASKWWVQLSAQLAGRCRRADHQDGRVDVPPRTLYPGRRRGGQPARRARASPRRRHLGLHGTELRDWYCRCFPFTGMLLRSLTVRSSSQLDLAPNRTDTQAAHPASNLDVSLRLFPLPLSGLPRTALETLPIKAMRPMWTEADDEPFLAPGMGKRPTDTRQEDTGGMYM